MLVDSPDEPERPVAGVVAARKRKLNSGDASSPVKKSKLSESGDTPVVAEDEDLIVL